MNLEWEVTPEELKKALNDPELQLVDVRQQDEFKLVNLGGFHIPLNELPERFHELDPDKNTVTVCHHGVRSMKAAIFLRNQGFFQVKSLRGGIDGWALAIDPQMTRY